MGGERKQEHHSRSFQAVLVTTGVAILQLAGTQSCTHKTDCFPCGWGWIPPRSANQVDREFPHIQAEGMSGLPGLYHLVVLKHPQQQPCVPVGILGHGTSGLSHFSSTLGWNTNRGDGLLANTQWEFRGSLGLENWSCSSLDHQGHLIKTDTHQSQGPTANCV